MTIEDVALAHRPRGRRARRRGAILAALVAVAAVLALPLDVLTTTAMRLSATYVRITPAFAAAPGWEQYHFHLPGQPDALGRYWQTSAGLSTSEWMCGLRTITQFS